MFGKKVRGSVAWACAAVLGLGVAAGCATCECGAKAPAAHVFAQIADSARYEVLHPRFKKAFDFIRRPDLAQLPCGRYEIDGSNCWAMVMDAKLKGQGDDRLHKARTGGFCGVQRGEGLRAFQDEGRGADAGARRFRGLLPGGGGARAVPLLRWRDGRAQACDQGPLLTVLTDATKGEGGWRP